MSILIVGSTYEVTSSRKGVFLDEFLSETIDFAVFKITKGVARAILRENVKCEGEHVEVRKTLCSFKQITQPPKEGKS